MSRPVKTSQDHSRLCSSSQILKIKIKVKHATSQGTQENYSIKKRIPTRNGKNKDKTKTKTNIQASKFKNQPAVQ